MEEFETILYEERDDVVVVTLNRPQVHNAFNSVMQRELRQVWRALRRRSDVGCVILTGAGDKAFCTGIDRFEAMGGDAADDRASGFRGSVFHFDDPGENVGPKTCDLWIPVIAAVNGMACGGAFYMLGEVEFIIAADHATFFDPHVTTGLGAVYESVHMLQKMPFNEVMRMSILGSHERMSATRANDIGLVSEVVPADELMDSALWSARAIASQPRLAVQATVRALWMARELNRTQALAMGSSLVAIGNLPEEKAAGQQSFSGGTRTEYRLR